MPKRPLHWPASTFSAHNRDDHVKNFSFLLDARNEWMFAPAYDLTFSYGPRRRAKHARHGRGKESQAQLNFRHWQTAWDKERAGDSGKRFKMAVANWRRYAEQTGVSRKSTEEIADKIKLQ